MPGYNGLKDSDKLKSKHGCINTVPSFWVEINIHIGSYPLGIVPAIFLLPIFFTSCVNVSLSLTWLGRDRYTQQIVVHEAPLCVLLVLEILCSSPKSTLILMLSAWCVSHVLGCALSVYHLKSNWVLVCLLWVNVVIGHMVNSKWFQFSPLWTQKKSWTHTCADLQG